LALLEHWRCAPLPKHGKGLPNRNAKHARKADGLTRPTMDQSGSKLVGLS